MSAESEAQQAAAQFRGEHHLGEQPLGDLAALIEQVTGIDVAVLDGEPDEHGLTMRDPARDAVFIAVARTPHPMRQRSSLAHELGHVVFADWTTGPLASDRTPTEVRADAFARHMLLPITGVRAMLGPPRPAGLLVLSEVVQRFLVSPALAAIALHEAGYIDAATKNQWQKLSATTLAARHGWADQYAALSRQSQQPRAPQRLTARAISGYLAHVVSLRALATLRGMEVPAVLAELRGAGIEPPDPDITWAQPDALPHPVIDLSALDDLDEDPDIGREPDEHPAPEGTIR